MVYWSYMKPLTPTSPHVIIMIGIPGAGKSTFAQRFADTFQAPIINESLLAREAELSNAQREVVANAVFEELLKTNRTLVYEGATDTRTAREALIKRITKAGYHPLLVWVQTESIEAKRRATRPYPKGSGLSSDEFERAVSEFQPPAAREGAVVMSGKHTYATQLKVVLKQLASVRPDVEPGPSQPRPSRNVILR